MTVYSFPPTLEPVCADDCGHHDVGIRFTAPIRGVTLTDPDDPDAYRTYHLHGTGTGVDCTHLADITPSTGDELPTPQEEHARFLRAGVPHVVMVYDICRPCPTAFSAKPPMTAHTRIQLHHMPTVMGVGDALAGVTVDMWFRQNLRERDHPARPVHLLLWHVTRSEPLTYPGHTDTIGLGLTIAKARPGHPGLAYDTRSWLDASRRDHFFCIYSPEPEATK